MNRKQLTTGKQIIAQAFSAAAETYDKAAFIEQEIGMRLLDRLACIKIQPLHILDLGCGTGYFSQQLKTMFPKAMIIGIDLAFGMVKYARDYRSNTNEILYSCADAENLPFADQSFDIIFSNCCITSANHLSDLSSELQRILRVDGLLLFTTLGPNTLQEFALEDDWLDMHNIGDIFVQAKFSNPVVDVENLIFNYTALQDLLQDLKETGSYQIADTDHIPNLDEPCSATFEVIYLHARGAQRLPAQFTKADGTVFISADSIKCL